MFVCLSHSPPPHTHTHTHTHTPPDTSLGGFIKCELAIKTVRKALVIWWCLPLHGSKGVFILWAPGRKVNAKVFIVPSLGVGMKVRVPDALVDLQLRPTQRCIVSLGPALPLAFPAQVLCNVVETHAADGSARLPNQRVEPIRRPACVVVLVVVGGGVGLGTR